MRYGEWELSYRVPGDLVTAPRATGHGRRQLPADEVLPSQLLAGQRTWIGTSLMKSVCLSVRLSSPCGSAGCHRDAPTRASPRTYHPRRQQIGHA